MHPAAIDKLLKTQPALWRGRDRYTAESSIPTGFTRLDNALPGRGWSIGGVTELLLEQQGIGELSLLLPGLRQVTAATTSDMSSSENAHANSHANNQANNGANTSNNPADSPDLASKSWAALINPPHIPYAPAFSNAGIALDRLLIINSGDDINTLWATEQVLRSGLFGAVVAWVQKTSAQRQRRLQLAAEAGGSWATLYRPLRDRKEHSPVSTRICLSMDSQQKLIAPVLNLDIIKIRAGSPQVVTIRPEEFDASQGAEWPVPGNIRSLSTSKTSGLRAISV